MKKLRIYFMGANGFPSKTYLPNFHKIQQKLQTHHNIAATIHGLDIYNPAIDCKNWKVLRNHIITQIEAIPQTSDPVIGVGHSIGGAMLAVAASHRPDLLSKLILIDSPYFHAVKRMYWGIGLKFLPRSTVGQLNSYIKKAQTKQYIWNSISDAREYLKDRNVFRDMDPEIFESFLQHGLITTQDSSLLKRTNSTSVHTGEVKLLFSREAESNLMHTVQIDLPFLTDFEKDSAGQYQLNPQLSGYFLSSTFHEFLSPNDVKYAQKHIFPSSFQFLEYHKSHFWPLFESENFSEEICQLINTEMRK